MVEAAAAVVAMAAMVVAARLNWRNEWRKHVPTSGRHMACSLCCRRFYTPGQGDGGMSKRYLQTDLYCGKHHQFKVGYSNGFCVYCNDNNTFKVIEVRRGRINSIVNL